MKFSQATLLSFLLPFSMAQAAGLTLSREIPASNTALRKLSQQEMYSACKENIQLVKDVFLKSLDIDSAGLNEPFWRLFRASILHVNALETTDEAKRKILLDEERSIVAESIDSFVKVKYTRVQRALAKITFTKLEPKELYLADYLKHSTFQYELSTFKFYEAEQKPLEFDSSERCVQTAALNPPDDSYYQASVVPNSKN
jgi:hypothetical protein